jgi:tetratricopeptide (TPR) repeat protein
MIFDYILIGVMVASLIIILIMVIRKFPMMAAINTAALPKHQHDKVKKCLIEDRLKRKFFALNLSKILRRSEGEKSTISFIDRFRRAVHTLEQKYRQRIETLQPSDENEAERKKSILLQEAKALAEQEKLKEAEAKYIEVISLDTKYVSAYEGLAEVYMQMKDYVHAKETYQIILKLNTADDSVYDHLGRIALQEGKLEEAEQDYLRSLSLNNQVAGYHIDLGEVYTAMGDLKKALNSFEEAIKLEPHNPRHLDSAIETALKLKDKATADKYLQKLKEVNPENEKLKEFVAAIDNLP